MSVRGLQAWYGESHVLHGLDFDIHAGEIVSMLGHNGAGKTTTLRALMGILPKRTGSVKIRGNETIGASSRTIVRLGVGYVPEERGIFSSLSVNENLLLPPTVAPDGVPTDRIFKLFPNLKARLDTRGTLLSGGEQQMLSIARILRTGARLLLFDEPTEGLAPAIIDQIRHTIVQLKAENFTILLVEQNVRFASKVADRHIVLQEGRIIETLTKESVQRDPSQLTELLGI
jgi:branched-chain amino acid transport system ATP-binding protein